MDLKQNILDKVELKNTVGLSQLITRNIKTTSILNSIELDTPVTEIRIQHFLRGLKPLVSEFKQKQAMDAIVTVIETLFETWGYEFSRGECFLIYHLKDLGKFRLKDDKFFTQLEGEWKQHKDYVLDQSEFKQSLKDLKNLKFLEYRRGTIIFNSVIVLRQ